MQGRIHLVYLGNGILLLFLNCLACLAAIIGCAASPSCIRWVLVFFRVMQRCLQSQCASAYRIRNTALLCAYHCIYCWEEIKCRYATRPSAPDMLKLLICLGTAYPLTQCSPLSAYPSIFFFFPK